MSFWQGEFSVEFWILVIVMFFNCGRVLKMYYKGGLTEETILSELDFFQIWF